jgi:stage V sporulation protein B
VPELSSAQAMSNKRQIEYIASRVISVTLLFSLLVSVTLISLSYELGLFIYNSHEAGYYIKLLSPLIPIMYLDIVTDTMLKGLGEQLYSMRVNIADSVISIILLLILLPVFGIKGYVTALFITELFNTSMSVIRLSDVAGIKAPMLKWVIKPLFSAIFSVFLTNLIPTLFPFGNLSSLVFKIVFITLFYITISRLIGTISKEDVRWAKSLVNVK